MSELNEKYFEGQEVKGTVTGVNSNAIYLEIEEGVKAVIYAKDILDMPKSGKLYEEYSEGSEFTAQVKSIGKDKKNGSVLLYLSTKLEAEAAAREAKEQALDAKYESFKALKESDEIIEAKVVKTTKAGADLSYNKTRVFLPYKASSLSEEALKAMVGETLSVIVTYVNVERRSVAVSQIAAEKKTKRLEKEAAFNALEVGQVVEGQVGTILEFGAIVNLGSVSGLLHISEIDHMGVKDVKKVLSVGQKVTAKVIKISEDGKVGLSIKALSQHPWEVLKEKYHVGDVFDGTVKKIIPAGLIIELTPEYSGLMPKVEYSWFVNEKYEGVVEEGSTLAVKVKSLDDAKHRVSLSHRETIVNNWADVKLRRGDIVDVTIVSVNDKGAQVRYADVQGFLPVSEVTGEKRVSSVSEKFPVDSTVTVMVQECDPSRAKLVVSAKAVESKKERDTFDSYMKEQEKEETNTTLSDVFAKFNLE